MARDEKTIAQTFTDYIQTFQTLTPKAIVPYFHTPCMLISAPGVVVLTNPSDIEMLVGRRMGDLKARGYGRSELTDIQISQISETAACVSVNRVRYKTDGQELERLGETYTLRKSDGAWKIVVATIHDPGIVLRAA